MELTSDQIDGLIKLVNDEIKFNSSNQDDAYNGFWKRIRTKLANAKK